MYDYISVHSDEFALLIKTDLIENLLILNMNFTKLNSLVFMKELSGSSIIIRGIKADAQGNYAFDSADEFKEINLIEIDIPDNCDDVLEVEILKIAQKISNEFLWKIDLRE